MNEACGAASSTTPTDHVLDKMLFTRLPLVTRLSTLCSV